MQHNSSSNYPGSLHHAGQLNANSGPKLQSHREDQCAVLGFRGIEGGGGLEKESQPGMAV